MSTAADTARPGRTRAASVRPLGWRAAEQGGATLVGLALSGLVLMTGVVAVNVGALVGARAAVQTAADMAALAALTPGQRDPPSRATEIAAANGAELVLCACSPVQAVVHVRRRVRLVPGGLTVSLTAAGRAVLGGAVAGRAVPGRAVLGSGSHRNFSGELGGHPRASGPRATSVGGLGYRSDGRPAKSSG